MQEISNNRIVIVMPAYNAGHTIKKTLDSIKIDESYYVILCDDASKDNTTEISRSLGIDTLMHEVNRGYGGNQKTLYQRALSFNPEIIIMIHPDNQYNLDCLPQMISKIESGSSVVLGSRMNSALKNKMPYWKYIANKSLTSIQNIIFMTRMPEFHSGLRAYDANLFSKIPYMDFSDDFVFDSELLMWSVLKKQKLDYVDTDCYYKEEVSSINFKRSVEYGLETLLTLLRFLHFKYIKNE